MRARRGAVALPWSGRLGFAEGVGMAGIGAILAYPWMR
jgi:hypothetical protein